MPQHLVDLQAPAPPLRRQDSRRDDTRRPPIRSADGQASPGRVWLTARGRAPQHAVQKTGNRSALNLLCASRDSDMSFRRPR